MLRWSSIVLAVLALVVPPTWAYLYGQAAAQAMQREQGWVCGTPLLGLLFLAGAATALLSLASFTLGAVAFRRLPQPRAALRKLELTLLLLPLGLAMAAVGLL